MTQRERHTPDDGATHDTSRTPPASGPVPPSSLAQPTPGVSSLWTEWFQRASPAQQQDAVTRAASAGVVYAHQLAAPAYAAAGRPPSLSALLNGSIKDLQPLRSPCLEHYDGELDRRQRDAVVAAIATPDFYLIQGFPGTGKSRVIAEIILQAARHGQRVLFLAPTTAALDSVLQRLSTHSTVCPLRCLGPKESQETLPACIARLTLTERLRHYRENTVPAARAAVPAARRILDARLREQPVWARLDELAGQQEQLAGRLRTLTERCAGLAAEVDGELPLSSHAEDAFFRTRWDACVRVETETRERLESQLAVLQAELDTIKGKQGQLEGEWERIRPLVEARQRRRFWTVAWWRAVTRSGLGEQVRDVETRRADLQAARQRLEQDVATCSAERDEVERHHAEGCRRLKEEEITRLQAKVDVEIAAVSREYEVLREHWRTACETLPPGAAPAEMSRQATAAARAEWDRLLARDQQQAACVEQWAQAVEEGLRTLPDKLAACANVVAATTSALAGDAHFGERNGTPAVSFDLLILEEAHQVTESEFAAAAGRARRWVLVGEPQLDAEPPLSPRKVVKPTVLRPGFFQRLWHNLHTDPRRLPFAWMQRDGRLVCRLRTVPVEQERWIESEPVADRPEIELRIVAPPRQAPQIAEVVFPAYMTIGEAKQFIFHELDELAVQTRGRSLCWSESAEDVVLELAPNGDPDAVAVTLDEGVRELVGCVQPAGDAGISTLWHTCALRFARASGWTRERAEEWVADRLGLRTLGRTALLTAPHRLDPLLARFLSDLLFGGAYEPAALEVGSEEKNCSSPHSSLLTPHSNQAGGTSPRVEFVAVPSLASLESRHGGEADSHWGGESPYGYGEQGQAALSVRSPRLRSVKGGAGLEVDLADTRPLEQLPAQVRAILPRHGLVNYLEARALVRRLETLVSDAAFVAASQRWRQRRTTPCEHQDARPSADCGCPPPNNGPTVAVMALYPAQAQLIQHLIRQTPALVESPVAIEVGLPSAFGQRECLVALVSLTRSHTHRAVSYGDHPHVFVQALTRAAAGLVLFGDPGTLARRGQWQGALDHLDETAAQRERGLVTQLVHYLQGHGPHPGAFQIQEGSSV